MLGKFLTDPVWWFFLFWLPQYFNSRFKLDLSHIGLPLVVVYVSSTVGSVGGGWLPEEVHQLWNVVEVRTAGSDADLCVPCGSDCGCRRPDVGVVCRGAC